MKGNTTIITVRLFALSRFGQVRFYADEHQRLEIVESQPLLVNFRVFEVSVIWQFADTRMVLVAGR